MASNGTPSMIGNQPIGMQHGIGLNEVNLRTTALAADIARAVAESGGTASRRDIFAMFSDRGSRAVVYRHIADVLDATGAKLAPTKLAPRPMLSDEAQEAELHAAAATVEEIETMAAGVVTLPPAEPPARQVVAQARGADLMVDRDGRVGVDVAAGLERALTKCEALMAMAETEEGKIRNPRLLVVAIDLYGKTAERKARVDADLSEASTMQAYLRALTAAAPGGGTGHQGAHPDPLAGYQHAVRSLRWRGKQLPRCALWAGVWKGRWRRSRRRSPARTSWARSRLT